VSPSLECASWVAAAEIQTAACDSCAAVFFGDTVLRALLLAEVSRCNVHIYTVDEFR